MTALRAQLAATVALPLAGALACAATGAALVLLGPAFALLPLALAASTVAVLRPTALLAAFLLVVVLLETDEQGFLPQRAFFFAGVPALADLVFILVGVAIVADVVRRRRPLVLPGPFTLPLALLAIAVAFGLANGYFAGASPREAIPPLQALVPLVVLPLLVVNVEWTERRDRALVAAAAALAAVKGLEGTVSWLLAAGRPVGDTTLTFYSPAPNFLLLLFLLGVFAAALARLRAPVWVLVSIPFCAAAFVLSYRRNFWIAAVLGLAVLLVLGARLRAGRAVVVGLLVFALAVRAIVGVTGAPELEGDVAERLRSLSPERVRTDPYDRYRFDEARNVLAEIRREPVTGLGLGVPWTAYEPLPAELKGGRQYTHIVLLWYWLKLGLLGALAYVALMATAVATAVRIARRHPDPVLRVTGLAVASGLVALAAAETTGSFTGVGYRSTVVVAAIVGWLAVVSSRLRQPK